MTLLFSVLEMKEYPSAYPALNQIMLVNLTLNSFRYFVLSPYPDIRGVRYKILHLKLISAIIWAIVNGLSSKSGNKNSLGLE